MNKPLISKRFFTNLLIVLFGAIVLLATLTLTFQTWFSSADNFHLSGLGINYPSPEFVAGSEPAYRIASIPTATGYQFLEVYNESIIDQAFGSSGSRHPAYKITYTQIIGQSTSQKPLAVVPLPPYQYGIAFNYLPREGDPTDRLLRWAYNQLLDTNLGTQRELLQTAIREYGQAITFATSTYRISENKLFSRDPVFYNTTATDPDIVKVQEFPYGNPADPTLYWALTIPTSSGFRYTRPTANSLALSVLQSGLREATRQGNTADKDLIQAAINNYSSQVQTSSGAQGLSISSRNQIEYAGQDNVRFSSDLRQITEISGSNYLKTISLTIQNIEVCQVSYASETAFGTTSSPNCQWNDSSHSGTFLWNNQTGTDTQAIGTDDQGTKTLKLSASGSNGTVMRTAEKAVTIEPSFADTTTTGNFGIRITVPQSTNRVEQVPVKISASALETERVGAAFLRWYVCNRPREQVSADSRECDIKSPEIDVNGKNSLAETTVYWNSSGAVAGETKSVMVKLFTATASDNYVEGSKTFSSNILVTDVQQGGGGNGSGDGSGSGGGTLDDGGSSLSNWIANFRSAVNIKTIQNLLPRVGSFTMLILAALAVIAIIIAGMRYITSGGDPKGSEAGKKAIIFAVYGIVLAVLCVTLVQITYNEAVKIFVTQPGAPTDTSTITIGNSSTAANGPTLNLNDLFGQDSGLIWHVIRLLMYWAETVAVFFILYASFLYLTTYGDESKAESAKKTLIWAIIGLAFILGASYLLQIFTKIIV